MVLRLHFQGPTPVEGLPTLKSAASRRLSLPARGQVWLPGGPATVPFYHRPHLQMGSDFRGPALLVEDHATLLVMPGFRGEILAPGQVLLARI